MISTQSRSAHRGFSLIEVAIALVIFVIGALAIIRIFPGALSVIGNNGEQQLATNSNRSISAALKTEGAVPDATFNIFVDPNNGSLKWTVDNADHTSDYADIAASVIGVPRLNSTLPTTDDVTSGANNSALSRFRGIVGEQAKVINIGGEFYAQTQFPISLEKINNGTNDQLVQPAISQEYVVQNARIDKLGNITFADATTVIQGQEYRLDATSTDPAINAEIALKNGVTASSMFYISYRYLNGAARVWGVSEEAVPVSAALSLKDVVAGVVKVSPPTSTRGANAPYNNTSPATTGFVAESIDVRVKRFAGTGDFGTTPATPPTIEQVTNARCGLVRIGQVSTPTVSVDYIADWSLLMQRGIPSIAPNSTVGNSQLALGARYIDDRAPVGIYALLFKPIVPVPADSNFENYELTPSQFGTQYPPAANPAPNTLALPADAMVNGINGAEVREDQLRDGRATFNVDVATRDVTRARVAYRTRDNWVQQLSVAANSYTPWAFIPVIGATPRLVEPWRDYYLGDDNYLYFHAGEAGKTISVSYRTTDDNGPLVDRPFVIDAQIIATPTGTPANVPANFAPSGFVSRVKLTDASGAVLTDNGTATGVPQLASIQAVKGNSVTVRTAYLNGSKYAQALLTSNRETN